LGGRRLRPTARLKPLLAKVELAIVRIRTEALGDRGFGVVVDAATGLVATNYHVIAGATKATVTFASDSDHRPYPVEGLLATMPGKDLALIRIKVGDKKLHALKVAEKAAVKGQAVYAGVPLGFPGVLSSGKVADVASGQEVSDLLTKLGSPGYYKAKSLDPDAVWMRVESPISPGRNSGPLVNANGELVGITTFRYDSGPADNLHYAISAIHLKKLMATAGTKVTPLSPQPPAVPLAALPDIPWQDYRTWTSSNGRYRIKAKLIGVKNGVATLKTFHGKTITVDIEKLSDEDQQLIEIASEPSPEQPK
jgi:S1-C subfamily serine protease